MLYGATVGASAGKIKDVNINNAISRISVNFVIF